MQALLVKQHRNAEPCAACETLNRIDELDRLARDFADAWIWFANAPEQDIAIERERYARYDYKTADANVRSVRLHAMRTEAGEGKPLEHSTLSTEQAWLKDLVLATWARD